MPFDRREGDRRSRDRRESDRRIADRRKGPVLAPREGEPCTAEDVTELRGHLEYEMWMLTNTIDYLTRKAHRVGEPDLNAYLESFFLHANALIYFFFPPRHGGIEGVVASDFVPAWNEDVEITDRLEQVRQSTEYSLGRISCRTLELPTKKQLAAIFEEFESLRTRFETMLNVRLEGMEDTAPEE